MGNWVLNRDEHPPGQVAQTQDCWRGYMDCNCLEGLRVANAMLATLHWRGYAYEPEGSDRWCPAGDCYPIPEGVGP